MPEKPSIVTKEGKSQHFKKWKKGELNIGRSEQTVPVTPAGQKQAVAIMLSQGDRAKKKRKKKSDSIKYQEGALLHRYVSSDAPKAYSEAMLELLVGDRTDSETRLDKKAKVRVNAPHTKKGFYYRTQEVSEDYTGVQAPKGTIAKKSAPSQSSSTAGTVVGAIVGGLALAGAGAAAGFYASQFLNEKNVSDRVAQAKQKADQEAQEKINAFQAQMQREREKAAETVGAEKARQVDAEVQKAIETLEKSFAERESQIRQEVEDEVSKRVKAETESSTRRQMEEQFQGEREELARSAEAKAAEREAEATRRTAATTASEIRKQVTAEYEPKLQDLEKNLNETRARLLETSDRSQKRIRQLEGEVETLKATEEQRVADRVRAEVDPQIAEFQRRAKEIEDEYTVKAGQLEADYNKEVQRIESEIEQRATAMSADTIRNTQQKAIAEINKERIKAQNAAKRDVSRKTQEIRAELIAKQSGDFPKGSLIYNDENGIELRASVDRGFAFASPTDPQWRSTLESKILEATDVTASRLRERALTELAPDFKRQIDTIASATGKERNYIKMWQRTESAHLRQTNRENAVMGAIDEIQAKYKERQREVLNTFVIQAQTVIQTRGKDGVPVSYVNSLDKQLKQMHRSMVQEIDKAIKDAKQGQPLDMPPGFKRDAYEDGMGQYILKKKIVA